MSAWLLTLVVFNITCLIVFAVLLRREKKAGEVSRLLAISNSRVPSYNESLPQIKAEISRARRYHRRLTVVVIRLAREVGETLDRSRAGSDLQLRETRFLFLGGLLRQQLRNYDIVTFDHLRDQYVTLLVETNRRQAKDFIVRLSESVAEKAGITVVAGVAEFPYSGLILEDLVSKAGQDCQVAEVKTAQRAAVAAAG